MHNRKKKKIILLFIAISLFINAENIQKFQTNKKIEIKKMGQKEIRNIIVQVLIDELGIQKEQISDDSLLAEDLGADSFSIVVIVVTLEEKFNIVIKDEVLERIRTVRDLINIVKNN